MTINLVVDLLYTVLDPRVRLDAGGLTVSTVDAAAPEIAPVAVTAAAQQAIETPFRRVVARVRVIDGRICSVSPLLVADRC